MGFGIALTIVVNDVEQYRTFWGSTFTLYQSSLGNFDFGNFSALPSFQRFAGQVRIERMGMCADCRLATNTAVVLLELNFFTRSWDNADFPRTLSCLCRCGFAQCPHCHVVANVFIHSERPIHGVHVWPCKYDLV